ncbi:BatA domain-containing protein [Winogradskyella jejuensis]|uniref:N-terminal double-transmembrane domain-containing protein n=1 Tax=Winogradskyella jejuensis TaxID=1089305 RepID=A0A1M5U1Z1_9FLAO|nr:BatA domain-containing protein [Winogradskyella jejuensis]SHH57105.1 N-terminal double-transmembrane domain-containing protein [Winogradskyella jejuensis]
MQFKHPELLWALLVLLIPIIIHLFQLRRFQKVAFTNVKFLKKVKLQTRKSSQIKKWLTLLTRMLLLACLVFAFAQPFTTNSDTFNAKNETVIYLDNSFSMQAKGNNGSLLNASIQDILRSYSEDEELTIFTNDDTYRNTTVKAIANDLIGLQYSANQLSYKSAYLKGKQYFSKDASSLKNLILVSDFQQKDEPLEFDRDSTVALRLVKPKAVYSNNISVDSIYISKYNNSNIEIGVDLSHKGDPIKNVSVSLHNNEELVAKTSVDINEEAQTAFTIPNNTEFNGVVSIEDASLQYDNKFYFNINTSDKIKVLSINEASDEFLKKLYTDDEFVYTAFDYKSIDYSKIETQNLIVLNELKTIPNALITALKAFKDDGGSIVIITSDNLSLNTYNQLLTVVSLPVLTKENDNKKQITSINYDHPILSDAFYNRVSNFQYPKVNTSYSLSSNTNAVYKYDDNTPFLVGNNKSFLFTAPINTENSNFKKSPLIVPVLYNIGMQSLEIPKLYYTIGTDNTIDINVQLSQDEILSLEKNGDKIIPLQQTYSKKVSIFTNEFPKDSGILNVKNSTETLKKLSFNHARTESNLVYYNLIKNNNYSIDTSLTSAIETIKSNASINALWKWFVIFALVFLIIEMLILKYLK